MKISVDREDVLLAIYIYIGCVSFVSYGYNSLTTSTSKQSITLLISGSTIYMNKMFTKAKAAVSFNYESL